MSSYKIYLTRSNEVAYSISRGYLHEKYLDRDEKQEKISVGSGMVHKDCRIPEIYHDKGYFYCIVEYKNGDGWDNPKYELIIA